MQGVPPWHTAEEMQQISNFVHYTEGFVVGAVGIAALLHARRQSSRAGPLWPWLVLIAGSLLAVFLAWPHAAVAMSEQLAFLWHDAQQRQHILIAGLLIVGGAAELRFQRGEHRTLGAVFPGCIGLIGWLFLVHEQHGTAEAVKRAALLHAWLGSILLAAAILRGIDVWQQRRSKLRYAWPILLLIAAFLLFLYREPVGAYHGASHIAVIARELSQSPGAPTVPPAAILQK
jgi:hypothetical protein